MSELKAYYGDVYIPVYGSIADAKVYLKSDADKVIAEKDKEIAYLQSQLELARTSMLKSLAQAQHEARHHKYKRYVNMADLCFREYQTYCAFIDRGEDYSDKMNFYERWHKRWLELAEKFKPNNSTAQ